MDCERVRLTQNLALVVNATFTGALCFASCVTVPTMNHFASNPELVKQYFPVMWPKGGAMMGPLCASSVLINLASYWMTNDWRWLIPASMYIGVGLFTKFVMVGGSIGPLMTPENLTNMEIKEKV